MSNLDNVINLLENLVLKFGGEAGEKLVKHNHLIDGVLDKLGVILKDDNFVHKLDSCSDDDLEVINSRLTMIINKIYKNEEVTK